MSDKAGRKVAIFPWNLADVSAFEGREYLADIYRPRSSNLSGETQWDCPGNKVRSRREQSAASSCPNRCPRGCYMSSRCADACACASGEAGSPKASTSSCSSNRAAIRWPTSRKPTLLQAPWNAPSIPRNTPISGRRPGTASVRASSTRGARSVAAHRPAHPRERAAGTCRFRLAGHGRFLRRRRTHRRPCRRQLPPHRHSPVLPQSRGPPS